MSGHVYFPTPHAVPNTMGIRYLVVVNNNVVVYSAATAEPEGECKHPARVNSAVFVGGRAEGEELLLATCADDKFIRFFRAKDGDFVVSILCRRWLASHHSHQWRMSFSSDKNFFLCIVISIFIP